MFAHIPSDLEAILLNYKVALNLCKWVKIGFIIRFYCTLQTSILPKKAQSLKEFGKTRPRFLNSLKNWVGVIFSFDSLKWS